MSAPIIRRDPARTVLADGTIAEAAPSVDVYLLPGVLEAIRRHARGAAGATETGGILIGPRREFSPLTIAVAGGPGPRANRTATSVYVDQREALDLLDANPDLAEIGHWHTHPGAHEVEPSEQDLVAAKRFMRNAGATSYVEAIVTPDPLFGWDFAHATAYVIAPATPGRPALEAQRAAIRRGPCPSFPGDQELVRRLRERQARDAAATIPTLRERLALARTQLARERNTEGVEWVRARRAMVRTLERELAEAVSTARGRNGRAR